MTIEVTLTEAAEQARDGREVYGVTVAMLFEWMTGVGGLLTLTTLVVPWQVKCSTWETFDLRSSRGGAGLRGERSRAAGRRYCEPEELVMDARVRGREGGVSEEDVEERRE